MIRVFVGRSTAARRAWAFRLHPYSAADLLFNRTAQQLLLHPAKACQPTLGPLAYDCTLAIVTASSHRARRKPLRLRVRICQDRTTRRWSTRALNSGNALSPSSACLLRASRAAASV